MENNIKCCKIYVYDMGRYFEESKAYLTEQQALELVQTGEAHTIEALDKSFLIQNYYINGELKTLSIGSKEKCLTTQLGRLAKKLKIDIIAKEIHSKIEHKAIYNSMFDNVSVS